MNIEIHEEKMIIDGNNNTLIFGKENLSININGYDEKFREKGIARNFHFIYTDLSIDEILYAIQIYESNKDFREKHRNLKSKS